MGSYEVFWFGMVIGAFAGQFVTGLVALIYEWWQEKKDTQNAI